MIPVRYKNTRGSNMDDPPWFDPNAKRPSNLSPGENARRDALLKRLEADCKDWHDGQTKKEIKRP